MFTNCLITGKKCVAVHVPITSEYKVDMYFVFTKTAIDLVTTADIPGVYMLTTNPYFGSTANTTCGY